MKLSEPQWELLRRLKRQGGVGFVMGAERATAEALSRRELVEYAGAGAYRLTGAGWLVVGGVRIGG